MRSSNLGSLIVASLLMAACGTQAPSNPVSQGPLPAVSRLSAAAACQGLAGHGIDASHIGLPTGGASIISAELVLDSAEGNANGEYCKILGAIHPIDYHAPDINFQVNLPSRWNGRSIQFGGGGLNGTLVNALGRYTKQPDSQAPPLAQGYVTLGSDSGHQSSGGFDGSFYLNREALENFGGQQIKKTHDVAMHLIQARYGKRPDYVYFIGGSQGGHEGFDAVQRFPADYDGVIAGYPAHNVIMLHLSALNYAKALQANDGRGWLSPEHAALLVEAVYRRCDNLDGAVDGIISNVVACHQATEDLRRLDDRNPLRCPAGNDGAGCLSDSQITTLNVFDSPYEVGFRIHRDDGASAVFPKWTPFEGSTFLDGGFPNLGAQGPGQALQFAPGDATARLAIAQDLTLDVLRNFDPRQWAGRITSLTPVLSANSANLDGFQRRGGKLIFFHGMVDDFITPYSSIQYYQRLLQHYGESSLGDFVRFYTIPGMGHQTGVFNARISTLEALEDWVERGIAPGTLEAVDVNAATAGRTRPVCHYPAWPRYRGAGDLDRAASFECTAQ